MLNEASKFIVELRPPTNPANLDKYFARISRLVELTGRVSIASKPPEARICGFETSLNLARYLREKLPSIDILFHLTCYDLNKVNIGTRLSLLKHLNIVKILLLTGDDYDQYLQGSRDSKWQGLFYNNSDELLKDITEHYRSFHTIAVGGYPGGDGHRSHNNKEESERIVRKVMDGANAVYTQCVFDQDLLSELERELGSKSSQAEIVPSVALFQNSNDLERIANLTRVRGASFEELRSQLMESPENSQEFSVRYLENLCCNLLTTHPTIDLCLFGQFDLASSLILRINKAAKPEI